MEGTSSKKTDLSAAAKEAVDHQPPTKQTKTGWEKYELNCNHVLNSAESSRQFATLAQAPVTVLKGIGMHSGLILKNMGCEFVKDLASYKYWRLARAVAVLAKAEEPGQRPADSCMNIDRALVQEYEGTSLKKVVQAPVQALQGIGKQESGLLESLGIHTVQDLAESELFRNAEAIVEAAKYEHILTDPERAR